MRTFNLEEIAEAHWHMEAKKKTKGEGEDHHQCYSTESEN